MTLLASLGGGHAAGVEEALVLLLIVAAAVAIIARRVGAPYTVGLVLVGLALGLTTLFNDLRLSSDLVFYVFLPILLFEAAFNLEARHLITDWRRILALAVPGVLVAFALTAIGLHLVGGATWTIALLFGALIAATDPVSVVAMFRRLGVPERLTTMIDAESLFNDGTAAVVFAIVVAAVVEDRDVTALWAAGEFVWMAAGGLAVGLAIGYAASALHRLLDDHLIEITLSTIVAYGSFLLGQQLGMSGVVACVAAGIVVGNFGTHIGMGPVTRVTMSTVWEYAAFVANSLIFLLIGLRIDLGGIAGHVGLVVVAFVVVLAARAATIYGYGFASRLAGRRLPVSMAARAGVGRPARHHRPGAGAQPAGRRARARTPRGGHVRRGAAVAGGTGAHDAVAGPAAGAGGRGGAGRERAPAAGAARRLRASPTRRSTGCRSRACCRARSASISRRPSRTRRRCCWRASTPWTEEPPEGEADRLAARIGALLAQRRRIEALRLAGVRSRRSRRASSWRRSTVASLCSATVWLRGDPEPPRAGGRRTATREASAMNGTLTDVAGLTVGHWTDAGRGHGLHRRPVRGRRRRRRRGRARLGAGHARDRSAGARQPRGARARRAAHRGQRLRAGRRRRRDALARGARAGLRGRRLQGAHRERRGALRPGHRPRRRPARRGGRRGGLRAASRDAVPQGSVGAGTGATIGKVMGLERATKGGLGSASAVLGSGAVVGAWSPSTPAAT